MPTGHLQSVQREAVIVRATGLSYYRAKTALKMTRTTALGKQNPTNDLKNS